MKILFFNPEQYVSFDKEPSNYELRLPIINCGIVSSYYDYIYQRILLNEGSKIMNRKALEIAFDLKPDLIIYSTTWDDHSLKRDVIKKITKRKIPVYTHVWDTLTINRPKEIAWFLDSHYLGIADSVLNYFFYRYHLRFSNARAVLFTPGHNVFTDIVKKMNLEKTLDVTLLGSNEGLRVRLIQYLKEKLIAQGIEIHKIGGLVDDTKTKPEKGLRLTDNWIPWEEYVKTINKSKICLSSQTVSYRTQIKGKVFDILACGTFCLTDRNREITKIIPDECVGYYTDFEDCYKKIIYYLENEEEREAIAKKGYEWYHSNFNYKKFWSEFLLSASEMKENVPTLPILEYEYNRFLDEKKEDRFFIFLGINPLRLYILRHISILRFILEPFKPILKRVLNKINETLGPDYGPKISGILKKIWYVTLFKGKIF
ncbi:MAG TPA: glycosyltransferase [Syntrophorhabdaceae bacterium]|mgnify:CR=1 FL=1|nr:glycosyltransferase [Syntrophorhabdaceae bacterium]